MSNMSSTKRAMLHVDSAVQSILAQNTTLRSDNAALVAQVKALQATIAEQEQSHKSALQAARQTMPARTGGTTKKRAPKVASHATAE